MNTKKLKKYLGIISVGAALYWMVFLLKTTSYYQCYLVVGLLGFYCFLKNRNESSWADINGKLNKAAAVLCCALFSLAVTASNYDLFLNLTSPPEAGEVYKCLYQWANIALTLLGGGISFMEYPGISCRGTIFVSLEERGSPSKSFRCFPDCIHGSGDNRSVRSAVVQVPRNRYD